MGVDVDIFLQFALGHTHTHTKSAACLALKPNMSSVELKLMIKTTESRYLSELKITFVRRRSTAVTTFFYRFLTYELFLIHTSCCNK